MDVDEDTHYCLKCQTTIEGLMNYVNHKKNECPALHKTSKEKTIPITCSPEIITTTQCGTSCISSNSTLTVSPSKAPFLSGGFQSFDGKEISEEKTNIHNTVSVTEGVSSLTVVDPVTSMSLVNDSFISMDSYGCEKRVSFTNSLNEEPKSTTTGEVRPLMSPTYINFESLMPNKKEQEDKTKKPNLSVEVTESMPFENSAFSPSTSRMIDPNDVLTDKHVSDFFASLELQVRPHDEEAIKVPENMEKSPVSATAGQKALPISSILDDLGFSSDSDFIPSDDDLLNYEDDNPPRYYTGGKWKPGQRPSHVSRGKWIGAGKQAKTPPRATEAITKPTYPARISKRSKSGKEAPHVEKDVSEPELASIGTENKSDKHEPDWKNQNTGAQDVMNIHTYALQREMPLENVQPIKTENINDISADDSNSNKDNDCQVDIELQINEQSEHTEITDNIHTECDVFLANAEVSTEITISASGDRYTCSTCRKTVMGKAGYQRHLESNYHKRRLVQIKESTNNKSEDETLICEPCEKRFHSKYSYVRHLLTSLHQRRAKEMTPIELHTTYQFLLLRQLPFQCLLCRYFCGNLKDLITHCETHQHAELFQHITGPFLCVRCKFKTDDNKNMIDHLGSSEHAKACKKVKRPCVVKEMRSQVPCKICSVVMHSATQLSRHMRVQHGEISKAAENTPKIVTIHCDYCKFSCISHNKLLLHMRKSHKNIKNFHCVVCQKSFTDQDRLNSHNQSERHVRNVGSGKNDKKNKKQHPDYMSKSSIYKCAYCEFSTEIYGDLRPHYISEHANMTYICEPCGKVLVNQKAWEKHLMTMEHKQKGEKCQQEVKKQWKCGQCGKRFPHKNSLEYHKFIAHSPELVDTVNPDKAIGLSEKHREYIRKMNVVKMKKKTGRSFKIKCPECDKDIVDRGLVAHLCMHEGIKPFQCKFCSKTFHGPYFLKRHLKNHFGLSEFTCEICNKIFMKKENLKNHIKTKHKIGEEVFHCKVCGKESYSIIQNRGHERIHFKSLRCTHPGCDRMFTHQSERKDHMRVHTKEKPYLCDQCGYAGKSCNQLTRHRRRHTGEKQYNCEYCEYRSGNSTNLRRHMRIHTGSKPYRCPYCEYSCNTFENLRKHILLSKKHKGKKVYPCKFCSFGTDVCEEMKSHLRKVHESEFDINDTFTSSVIVGIYVREEDPRKVPEGQMALPVKERKKRSSERSIMNKMTEDCLDGRVQNFHERWQNTSNDHTNHGTPPSVPNLILAANAADILEIRGPFGQIDDDDS